MGFSSLIEKMVASQNSETSKGTQKLQCGAHFSFSSWSSGVASKLYLSVGGSIRDWGAGSDNMDHMVILAEIKDMYRDLLPRLACWYKRKEGQCVNVF